MENFTALSKTRYNVKQLQSKRIFYNIKNFSKIEAMTKILCSYPITLSVHEMSQQHSFNFFSCYACNLRNPFLLGPGIQEIQEKKTNHWVFCARQRTFSLIPQARIFCSLEETTVHFSIKILQFSKLPLDKNFLLWRFRSHVIE